MKIIRTICNYAGYIASVVIVCMMLLVVADVFLRYVFNSPIVGTAELSERMMIFLLLGLAWCAIEGRHLNITIFTQRMKPKASSILNIFTLLAGLVVYIVICWQGVLASLYQMKFDVRTSRLEIPEFPIYWVLVIGFILLCVVMIAFIVQGIRKVIK